jgi:glycosyltransferase involved in cell wall biosynthesis
VKNIIVSIIIPNYNKADYIEETLQSIQNQFFQNWEAIIVDDGSNDNSIEIIHKYTQNDGRFKFIQRDREPKGGSVCRNIGLANAKGDFILFLDSDDLLIPRTLENRLQAFEKYPDKDFLVFPMGTFKNQIGDNNSMWIPQKDNHLKDFLAHDLPWHTMSPIWKKDFLLKLDGFDEEFPRLQDVELHTRALLQKKVLYKVFPENEPDCFYRIDEERIIGNYEQFVEKWIDGVIMYIKKMNKIINDSNRSDKERLLKYLKGTFVSILTQTLYASQQKKIDIVKKNKYIENLFKNANDICLLTRNDILLLKLYIRGYEAKLYRIKGYNYMIKKMVTL